MVYASAVKLISWNVNGLRAVLRKNFLDYLDAENPDVLCLQETRCSPDDVEQLWPAAYTTCWNTAQKKGYSGTAIFTRTRPLKVAPDIGMAEHDREGRVMARGREDDRVGRPVAQPPVDVPRRGARESVPGVGLCQTGASTMAACGADYITILQHYFTDSSVYRIYR